jgi:hypothetical protein
MRTSVLTLMEAALSHGGLALSRQSMYVPIDLHGNIGSKKKQGKPTLRHTGTNQVEHKLLLGDAFGRGATIFERNHFAAFIAFLGAAGAAAFFAFIAFMAFIAFKDQWS